MIYYEHSGVANAGFGIDLLAVKFSPQLLAHMLEDSDDSWSQRIMGERGEIVTTLKGHLIIWNPNAIILLFVHALLLAALTPGNPGKGDSWQWTRGS